MLIGHSLAFLLLLLFVFRWLNLLYNGLVIFLYFYIFVKHFLFVFYWVFLEYLIRFFLHYNPNNIRILQAAELPFSPERFRKMQGIICRRGVKVKYTYSYTMSGCVISRVMHRRTDTHFFADQQHRSCFSGPVGEFDIVQLKTV